MTTTSSSPIPTTPSAALPVALDAMGGDKAPAEILAGARLAAEEGLAVVLVGQPEAIGDTGGLEVVPASEVVTMDEDPAQAVRKKKDSSLLRAAEAVRDGRALAMVSAGNTGATMASALLRMGRLPGVARPAIAAPLPSMQDEPPTVLVDAGANPECSPAWLLQFAEMGAVFASRRYGIARPTIGLLSIGEEPSKGTSAVKETHALLAAHGGLNFVGNVEGRDLLRHVVDVVVTDGFTGNVALKTLEGSLRSLRDALVGAMTSTEEGRRAFEAILPALAPTAARLDPDFQGGAMLLGVNGVCMISHGSSSARAVANALRWAHDLAAGGVVSELREAVSRAPAG